MAAFLVNRTQRVKIGDISSQLDSPNGGVPQGTMSEPKDIQINDLRTPCPMYKYVDDYTTFEICTVNSTRSLQDSANIISDWSTRNDMKINSTKTKEMAICFCKNPDHMNVPKIKINGNEIGRVETTKVIGVTVSSDLTWNVHVVMGT